MSAPVIATAPRFLTTDDVAAELRLKPAAICDKINSGELPAIRTGRRWLIDPADLDAYIRAYQPPGTAAPNPGPVVDAWLTETLAKFTSDDLRRAGEVLRAVADAATKGGAA